MTNHPRNLFEAIVDQEGQYLEQLAELVDACVFYFDYGYTAGHITLINYTLDFR